jgi:hypothetical protein
MSSASHLSRLAASCALSNAEAKEKPPGLRKGVIVEGRLPRPVFAKSKRGLHPAFALELLARELARTPDGFSLLTGFFDGGFLEMLFKFHFAEHAFALELFLQGPKGLFDVIVADADLHVVFTTFLS